MEQDTLAEILRVEKELREQLDAERHRASEWLAATCRELDAAHQRDLAALQAAAPVEEVKVGFEILKSLELRHRGINVIACPTCGRVEIDVVRMANELEKKLGHIKTSLNESVLGCVVNGIGEGKEADIGIAGGEGKGILFKKGKLVRKVPIEELMDTLIYEVELMAKEKDAEGNGEVIAPSSEGWESLNPASDRSSTLGKESSSLQ